MKLWATLKSITKYIQLQYDMIEKRSMRPIFITIFRMFLRGLLNVAHVVYIAHVHMAKKRLMTHNLGYFPFCAVLDDVVVSL